MAYLYKSQPEPMNATGVPVTLSYTDSNNNTFVMGQTTSDINGQYSYTFTPTVPGTYIITAIFGGSASYYTSSAQTIMSFATLAASPTPTTTTATSTTADTYFVPAVIAIIVVMLIGFAVLAMLALRKKA
jgi:hypothetical protein